MGMMKHTFVEVTQMEHNILRLLGDGNARDGIARLVNSHVEQVIFRDNQEKDCGSLPPDEECETKKSESDPVIGDLRGIAEATRDILELLKELNS